MNTEANAIDIEKIKEMVREIVTTRSDEMDCPECFQHMDHFADLILNGTDAAAAMPRLQDHLKHCAHCSEEFDALLNALRVLD